MKPRGKRHEWDRAGKTASCVRCGLTVATYKIRKGGLPTCDQEQAFAQATLEKLLIEEKEVAMCLDGLKPIASCFSCPGRLNAKKCERLRIEGGYNPKKRKPLAKQGAITVPTL